MILHLGVVDFPYATPGGQTTGDVAVILEAKYGIMGKFYEVNQAKVAHALEQALADSLDNVLMGAPLTDGPFEAGLSDIRHEFDVFITTKQLDGLVDGVPTAAALAGVSHRFKSKKGPPRPSFVDTGLYLASFKAWMEYDK